MVFLVFLFFLVLVFLVFLVLVFLVFLVLVFWLFGSPSRSRGNNYAFLTVLMLIVLFRNSIQVVFLVLQNYLFRYYVSRAARVWCIFWLYSSVVDLIQPVLGALVAQFAWIIFAW